MNNLKYWIGNFIHNCIAHPLIPFLPKKWSNKLHDWTIIKFWPQATYRDATDDDEDTETMD